MISTELRKQLEKPAISKEIITGQQEKFKFKSKGKLRKDEIIELKKTNINVFDWMKAKQTANSLIVLEDDGQEVWMTEALEREERLARMSRRKEEWEKKSICRSVMDDILEAAARSRTSNYVLNMIIDVIETVIQEGETNIMMAEIKKKGLWTQIKEAIMKEEEKESIERIRLAKEDRIKKQELKRTGWQTHWAELESRLAEEMREVMELDLDTFLMETQTPEPMITQVMEWEDDEMEIKEELFEDWVMKEIEEMNFNWGPMEINDIETEIEYMHCSDGESMVGEESKFYYPTPHGDVHTSLPRPIIITEKGVELGWVGGGHFTGDMSEHTPSPGPKDINNLAQCEPIKDNTDMRIIQESPRSPNLFTNNMQDVIAPQTPGLSARLSRVELEDEECVCMYSCQGDHLYEEKEIDECLCSLRCNHLEEESTRFFKEQEIEKRYKEEQELGIKYCPDIERELPIYVHVEYKPRCSKDRPKLFEGLSVVEGTSIDENLLKCAAPEHSQPKFKNNTILNSKNISTKPSFLKIVETMKFESLSKRTLPGPRRNYRNKQKLCVSRGESGVIVWGGLLLAGQTANHKRAREKEELTLQQQRKRVKVFAEWGQNQ